MRKQVATGMMMAAVAALLTGCASTQGWQTTLDERLPVYGHRNWIVVADSAYPRQSAPGIETLYTGKSQIEVIEAVLQAVAAAPHVQAKVMIDHELNSVPKTDAPGIEAYRSQLKTVLAGKQVAVMPHEEIIKQLDEGAKLFNILILKTDMVLPYTSVFFELDCGYWNAEKEARLRAALK